MKITSDQAKAGLYIAAGVAMIYAAYKVFKVGSDAKQSVEDTLKGIGDKASTIWKKIVPTTPPPLSELPTSGDYPEAGPIREAITAPGGTAPGAVQEQTNKYTDVPEANWWGYSTTGIAQPVGFSPQASDMSLRSVQPVVGDSEAMA